MKPPLRILTIALLLLVPYTTAFAQGPSLSPLPNVTLNAGTTQNVNVVAVDTANRVVSVTATLPPFATLNPPTLGTGSVVTSLTLAPSAGQVGDYTAAVTATAGGVSSVRVFQITVNAAGSDQAPIVTAPAWQHVTEGSPLSFAVSASDPDGNAISSLSASGVPTGASFTANGSNSSGTFQWTPGAGDAGEYDVSFTATNALSGTSVTHVHVAPAPKLAIDPIADVTVGDGGSVSVPVHATGVPGALITLTAVLPAFATLNPPGSGTGAVSTSVTVSPPTGSAGTYHASITAISQGASVTRAFDIIVTGSAGGGNRPPVVSAPAADTVAIGSTLSFDVTASDPDGDHVDLAGTALPPGSSFTDHANDTGTFTWTPVAGQEGTYTASFTGTDGRGGSGSASTSITVTGVAPRNHAPTLSAPAAEQVNVASNLSFTVTASDSDGDHVTLSAGSMPSGATFSDNGNNTGTFSWAPGSTQVGNYLVAFLGYDGRGGSGTASTAISVMAASGGGGGGGGGVEVPGRACLVGKFKAHRDSTCFRIQAVDHSFDLRNVVLSSIRLEFHGQTIPALDGAHIELECDDDGHGHGEGDDHGDDHQDGDQHNSAAARMRDLRIQTADGHEGDDGEHDDCDLSCEDHADHDRDESGNHGRACDTLGIHVCFSTPALVELFSQATSTPAHASPEGKHLPCALVDAAILATLTSGDTVVATFRSDDHHGHHGDDDDSGDGQGGNGHDTALNARLMPNPLAPNTVLSFDMHQGGRVLVRVYDMQGRLVKQLLDEFRAAGLQTLAWDGTNQSNLKVSSGVYFVRIQAAEGSVTRTVAVVR
jgi:hypothetical protein